MDVDAWSLFVETILGLSSTGWLSVRSLADRWLSSLLLWLGQKLVPVVLRSGMVREVLSILALNDEIQTFELVESALSQKLHLS